MTRDTLRDEGFQKPACRLRMEGRAPLARPFSACAAAIALLLAAPPSTVPVWAEIAASVAEAPLPIKHRHANASREAATKLPRSEGDQALVDGWPLYRSERAQQAFNDAMAALKATDGPAPKPEAFKGCTGLDCELSLPRLDAEGWIPAGRIWVSPREYVLVVHSPRLRSGASYPRRSQSGMRYFVFHEFQNSTRNTDPYDTISSHSRSVFVPFYMSKQSVDAKGRRFVIVVQVAPYDVVCLHATEWGSAGAGIEVAKNSSEALEPLQGLAGTLIATMIKTAAPRLQVVNHAGAEGLEMLRGYDARLERLRARAANPTVTLPFTPAATPKVEAASARLEDLIAPRGASSELPIAERAIVARAQDHARAPPASLAADPEPVLVLAPRPAARPRRVDGEPMLVEPIKPATRPASLSGRQGPVPPAPAP